MAVIDLKTKMPVDPYEFPERFLILLLETVKGSQKWYWSATELWKFATKYFGMECEDFAVAMTTMLRQRKLRLKAQVEKKSAHYNESPSETLELYFILGERAAQAVAPEQTKETATRPSS